MESALGGRRKQWCEIISHSKTNTCSERFNCLQVNCLSLCIYCLRAISQNSWILCVHRLLYFFWFSVYCSYVQQCNLFTNGRYLSQRDAFRRFNESQFLPLSWFDFKKYASILWRFVFPMHQYRSSFDLQIRSWKHLLCPKK